MARIISIKIISTLLLMGLSSALCNAADQKVGKFVQLRGTSNIERDKKQIPAAVRGEILSSDIITTGSGSRAKLLFIDDSVLTMSDNSKLVVKEFIYSKGEQGKSVFNLLDGKMRSVVGKTKFEVHTPTAVAAARGTVIYFDVGMVNNQSYSKIICLEGNVQIRNIVPTVTGQVTLTPGTMVVVKTNEPPPPPIPAPPAEINKAIQATQTNNNGDNQKQTDKPITDNKPIIIDLNTCPPNCPPPPVPPIVQPRKVNINIGLP
jgi:hypothetical protein